MQDRGVRPPLVEREDQLAVLDSVLTAAISGIGQVALIQGASGIGKTRLLDEACAAARDRVTVLRAHSGEHERELPLAIAREWFQPVLSRSDAAQRAALLAGAAKLAAPLFAGSIATTDSPFAIVHGLYWLTANLADRGPMLLAIDDAHWADDASQRFLAYLLPRIQDLPVLIAMTVRPRELAPASHLAAALAALPDATVVEPPPLSVLGTAELIGGDTEFAAAVHRATTGNPLLVHIIDITLHAEGIAPTASNAARVESLAGDHIGRVLLPRLHRLGPDAVAVARAAAILGEPSVLADVAALANLGGDAQQAADRLVSADVLKPDRSFGFTHPLVRAAVLDELGAGARSAWHLRAARQLEQPPDIAQHLLFTGPVGDVWAAEALQRAAADASTQGAPDAAVAFLRRAIIEPLDATSRRAVASHLGLAALNVNHPQTIDWLADAVRAAPDPVTRTQTWIVLATAVLLQHRPMPADVVLREVPRLPDPLFTMLWGVYLCRWASGELADSFAVTVPTPTIDPDTDCPDRMRLGCAAFDDVVRCDSAARAVQFAERALSGAPPWTRSDSYWHSSAASALMFAAAKPQQALAPVDAAITATAAQGNRADWDRYVAMRAWTFFRSGDLRQAAADITTAPTGVDDSWPWGDPYKVALELHLLREQGELERAADLAANNDVVDPEASRDILIAYLLDSRGALHEAQWQWTAGLRDFSACGAIADERGIPRAPLFDWRAGAARCLAALGERDEALRLAQDQVADARRFGAAVWLGSSLRTLGRLTGGDLGLVLLRESVALLAGTGAKLEYAHALCELGVALRHAKHAVNARDPLRQALDLADQAGAYALTDRATHELLVAGARPRRRAITGIDSLTPAERRVATLAAQGLSNPQIAQSLFVTRKTVEKHLGSVYLKLAVTSRAELTNALAAN